MAARPFDLSNSLQDVFNITSSDVSTDYTVTGIRAAHALVENNLLSGLLLPRIERLLRTGGVKAPTLAAMLLSAQQRSRYSDITGDLANIHRLVTQLDSNRSWAQPADGVSVTSTDLASYPDACARIRPEDRHMYAYCGESERARTIAEEEGRMDAKTKESTVLFADVMRLIRSIQSGPEGQRLAESLTRQGISRFEVRGRAVDLIEDTKRVFKTNRLFDGGDGNEAASAVHSAIMQLVQNVDFVQHIMELMAMHLPPDYPWQSEQVVHVATWWIMQYVTMLRPQLVHAVIDCPDGDVNKCKLIGLSLGTGATPTAKWHGSSSLLRSSTGGRMVEDAMTIQMKWHSTYRRYRGHVDDLSAAMEGNNGNAGSGVFNRLTDDQKYNLSRLAATADQAWRKNVAVPARNRHITVPWLSNQFANYTKYAGTVMTGGTNPFSVDPALATELAGLGIGTSEDQLRAHVMHTLRLYSGDVAENALRGTNGRAPSPPSWMTTSNSVSKVWGTTSNSGKKVAGGGNATEERYGEFTAQISSVLLDTPERLFELLEDVFDLATISDPQLLDRLAYVGGLYRYGIDLRNYGVVADGTGAKRGWSRYEDEYDVRRYVNPKRLSSVTAFHANCRNIMAQIDASMNPSVTVTPQSGGNTVRPITKYRGAAICSALLWTCYHTHQEIQTYVNSMDQWYEKLFEYGIDMRLSTVTTHRETKPAYQSYYSDVSDPSEKRDNRWSHIGNSDTEISLNTSEWLDAITFPGRSTNNTSGYYQNGNNNNNNARRR
jgi:hypothetical protein